MKLKRKKNGFTMVELLAVVAILGIIVAIAVPVSLSYVRNSRDKAFYLNVQEIVEKVRMENELNRAHHCYYNVDVDEEESSWNQVAVHSQNELKLLSLIDDDKISHLSILSYLDSDEKIKYAVLAQETETGDWIDVLDFDSTSSDKNTWDDKGASFVISKLSNVTTARDASYSDSGDIANTFTDIEGKNKISEYQNDIDKCTLDFKEGN